MEFSQSSPTLAPLTESGNLDLSALWPPLASYCPHNPTERQAAFLLLDCQEAFYGGAAGGGKSDALLMAALQYVDRPGYAALILRRTFKQLDLPGAIMARAKEWLIGRPGVHWNDDGKTFTFASGGTLTFGYLENENDVFRYQGPEFQFVGFDELTQFAESQYRYLFSRTRRLVEAGVPVRMRSASNPGGIGHAWVKRRFVDERKPGVVFIPAKLDDNPHLDRAEYVQSLSELDPTLRAQLLNGDWGVFEGAAFTITDDHLIEEFPLDDAHDRFEAADYGLNGAPWALWCVDYEGNLIGFDMLYERELIPSQLCPLILSKRASGWGDEHEAYIDPTVWKRTGHRDRWGDPAMLADEFSDNGVHILRANNDPRAGLIRLRELLRLDQEHPFPDWHPRRGELGAPRLFFVHATMTDAVEELRSAPLQAIDKKDAGEIVDPKWESNHGHAVAMCRYAGMTRPDASVEPEPELEDPRARVLAEHEARMNSRHRRRYQHA